MNRFVSIFNVTFEFLDVLTDGVADLAVTLLLATSRRVAEAMRSVRVRR